MPNYLSIVSDAADISRPYYPAELMKVEGWLRNVIDPPIAAVIEQEIDKLRNKLPEYEPLLYDLYIGEAGAALDGCLSARREIQNLEMTAISHARQYERSARLREIDKKLDSQEAQALMLDKLETGFSESAGLLEEKGRDRISDAMKRQSVAISASHKASAAALRDRGKNLKDRWTILEQIEAAEKAQHSTPGHAMNFAERRQRIIDVLKVDISEAFKKMIAVYEGVKLTYGTRIALKELPKAANQNALDLAVLWTRDVIESLEKQRENEVEFDLVIPLVQKTFDRQGGGFGIGGNVDPFKRTPRAFYQPSTSAWLGRVLGEEGEKRAISSLRLVGIGASISNNNNDGWNAKTAIFNVVVFPPRFLRSLDPSMNKWFERAPVVLGNVRPRLADQSVAIERPASIRNQPIDGQWTVVVLPNVATGTADEVGTDSLAVTDLKLHLRVVGTPSNESKRW